VGRVLILNFRFWRLNWVRGQKCILSLLFSIIRWKFLNRFLWGRCCYWWCLSHCCCGNRRDIDESDRFIELSAVPEQHRLLTLFFRGFVHNNIMNCTSPNSIKFPILVVFLNKIILCISATTAISFIQRIKQLLRGRSIQLLRVESKGCRWVFYLIWRKLELRMLFSYWVEDKERMLSLSLWCFSRWLIKNYFLLKLLSNFLLISTESGCTASVTHSPSHSSLFSYLYPF